MENNSQNRIGAQKRFAVRLFIAGDAPNSLIARKNLERFQESLPGYKFDIEIVDVNENPQMALQCGVFVTPALLVIDPSPETLIFGNLCNNETLRNLFPEDV